MIRGHRVERFDRRVPGQDRWEPHALPATLFVRDRELRVNREVVGERFELRGPKVRDVRRTAEPWPNAPLLKRLVMNPYALDTDRVRRHQVFEGIPWSALRRDRTRGATQIYRDALIPPVQGSPLRAEDRQVVCRRDRPSADAWLRGREVT